MDKYDVAKLLKTGRVSAKLSVQEVSQKLLCFGIEIKEKTLYGYERAVSMPNVPAFIALCDIYGIDDIFSESKEITADEQELVSAYRVATEDDRKIVDTALKKYKKNENPTASENAAG